MLLSAASMTAAGAPPKSATAEAVTINRISDVGFNHSEVAERALISDAVGGSSLRKCA
jgi:hypothetical protein